MASNTFQIERTNKVSTVRNTFDELTPDNFKLSFNYETKDNVLSTDIAVAIYDDNNNYAGNVTAYNGRTGESTNVNFDVDDYEATMKQVRKEIKAVKAEIAALNTQG